MGMTKQFSSIAAGFFLSPRSLTALTVPCPSSQCLPGPSSEGPGFFTLGFRIVAELRRPAGTMRTEIQTLFLTLALGAAGAALAAVLSVPAPYLTGPAALVALVSVMGLKTHIPNLLRDLCFLVIGIGMGTGINPDMLAAAATWPLSLMALTTALVAIFLGGAAALERFFLFDRLTARLAASPGHLSFVLSLSADTRADIGTVAVVQSLRVLALTLLVPVAVAMISGADLSMGTRSGVVMALPTLAVVAGISVALGWRLKCLRIPAAYLLGGFVISSLGHAINLAPGLVPNWLALPAFAIMGTLIGTRFSGTTWAQIVRAAGAAALLAGLALAATVAAALAVHWALGLPLTTLLIAYAPGGLETMAAISVMLEADPAFVAFHHAFRVLLLTFLVPACLPRARA
jgi:uncharacterized protein